MSGLEGKPRDVHFTCQQLPQTIQGKTHLTGAFLEAVPILETATMAQGAFDRASCIAIDL